ncbi:hypothetical protein [Tengunoibacter tsumagoiensis]|uniref:LuxR family transcriptional regulator n=1 Tax=Tengunoibacter tsumagoiensis TaxID=2014871 RepID=A0A402A047_9CHLR|nr:hypothetical protein [Tengunoibacter tsumagoiensis]GCE12422.1 LuxR family transcriptional regulator [Tengunoibacter tsumagoiensis]
MTEIIHNNTSQTTLLLTKYSIPFVQDRLVKRERLFALLDEGLSRRLTLISGLAGAGKTTLLSSWLASRSISSVAWITLDTGDNDPVRFWNYLLAALKKTFPDLHIDIPSFSSSPTLAELELVIAVLINSLAARAATIVIIMDDYQVIDNPVIQANMSLLIDHLPAHVHIYLAGRISFSLPLARLRARAQLLEIHSPDLRFRNDEINAFFHLTPECKLDNTEIALLEEKTEGWAAGLRLVSIFLRSLSHKSHFFAAFKGTHYSVADYLLTEVFYQQPEETQFFLLYTSVPQHMTSSLCDAITERHDSETMLVRLERANLFLFSLDTTHCWYRYHHLFSDFLRWYLKQKKPDFIPILLTRAIAWYVQHDMRLDAIELALIWRDFDQATDLLVSIADSLLERHELTTLLRLVEQLPPSHAKKYPQLLVCQCWALLTIGQVEAAERCLDLVSDMAVQPEVSYDIITIRMMITTLRGDTAQKFEQAAHTDQSPSWLHGVPSLQQGLLNVFHGDHIAGKKAFTEASQIGLKANNYYGALVATCQLATLEQAQGKLHQSANTYTKALQTAQVDTAFLDASPAHIGLAGILLEWNDLVEADEHIQCGIRQSQQSGNQATLLSSYLALAQLYQARGETTATEKTVQEIEGLLQAQKHSSFLLYLLADTIIRMYLLQNNISAARKWERFCLPATSPPLDPFSLFALCSAARLRLAEHNFHAALRMLDPLRQYAEANQFYGPLLTVLLLQARALHALAKQSQALTILARAFALAEPERYCRTFLETGTPMVHLVSQLLLAQNQGYLKAAKCSRHYVQSIFSLLVGEKQKTAQLIPVVAPSSHHLLSTRELEILQLIAYGFSNQEIALF